MALYDSFYSRQRVGTLDSVCWLSQETLHCLQLGHVQRLPSLLLPEKRAGGLIRLYNEQGVGEHGTSILVEIKTCGKCNVSTESALAQRRRTIPLAG